MRAVHFGLVMLLFGACAFDDEASEGELLDDDELAEDVSYVIGTFVDGEADDHAARFNPHRRNHVGRGALDRRACLNEIAKRRARKMADGQCPGDDSICHFPNLGDAVTAACPFGWEAAGENVGIGPTERGLWKAFLASPPHHGNIDGRYNKFGVGAYRRASDDLLFIAHVFVRSP